MYVCTGCLKKKARLRLEAHNSSLEAAIGTCRDILDSLGSQLSFEPKKSVHGSLKKSSLKRATLT